MPSSFIAVIGSSKSSSIATLCPPQGELEDLEEEMADSKLNHMGWHNEWPEFTHKFPSDPPSYKPPKAKLYQEVDLPADTGYAQTNSSEAVAGNCG